MSNWRNHGISLWGIRGWSYQVRWSWEDILKLAHHQVLNAKRKIFILRLNPTVTFFTVVKLHLKAYITWAITFHKIKNKINLQLIAKKRNQKPKNTLWNKKMDDQCKSFIHSLLKDVSIIYLICKKVSFLFQQKTFQIYPRIIKRKRNQSIDRSIFKYKK